MRRPSELTMLFTMRRSPAVRFASPWLASVHSIMSPAVSDPIRMSPFQPGTVAYSTSGSASMSSIDSKTLPFTPAPFVAAPVPSVSSAMRCSVRLTDHRRADHHFSAHADGAVGTLQPVHGIGHLDRLHLAAHDPGEAIRERV